MALRASTTFCSAHAWDEVLCSASSSVFSCAIGLESTLNDISSQYLEDIICYTPVPARYATLYVSAVLDVPVRLPVTAHVPISLAKKNGGWSTAASLSPSPPPPSLRPTAVIHLRRPRRRESHSNRVLPFLPFYCTGLFHRLTSLTSSRPTSVFPAHSRALWPSHSPPRREIILGAPRYPPPFQPDSR